MLESSLVFSVVSLLSSFGLFLCTWAFLKHDGASIVFLMQFCLGVVPTYGFGLLQPVRGHFIYQFSLAFFCCSLVSSVAHRGRCRLLVFGLISLSLHGLILPLPERSYYFWMLQEGQQYPSRHFFSPGLAQVVGGTWAAVLCLFFRKGQANVDVERKLPDDQTQFFMVGSCLRLIGALSMQFAAGFLVKDGGEAFGINSLLCCALGGGVAFVLSRICAKHWSLFRIIGGMLAGLSIYGNSDARILPWAPLVLGPSSGIIYMVVRNLVIRLKLPDSQEILAAHLTPGFLGLILTRLFIFGEEMDYFLSFGWNALWVVLLVLWSSLTSLILFGALSCCKRLKRLDSAVPPLARNVANNNFMVELDEVVANQIPIFPSDNNHNSTFLTKTPRVGLEFAAGLNSSNILSSTTKDFTSPRLVLKDNPSKHNIMPMTQTRELPELKVAPKALLKEGDSGDRF